MTLNRSGFKEQNIRYTREGFLFWYLVFVISLSFLLLKEYFVTSVTSAQILNKLSDWCIPNILFMIKMTNWNITQRGTIKTGLGIISYEKI